MLSARQTYGRWYHAQVEKTTLYLPDDLRRSLADASRRLGRPQAELVRDALRRYLEAHGAPRPRSIGVAEGGGVSAAESEDWLREQWGSR